MKIEWWFDDATFASSGEHDLYLARQLVRDDGSAEVLLQSGERRVFADEDEANLWLGDEEYRRLEALFDDFADEGRPAPHIELPADDDLSAMYVVL